MMHGIDILHEDGHPAMERLLEREMEAVYRSV